MGKDEAQVALEAGNTPTIIFRSYRELVTPRQAEEWFGCKPGFVTKRHHKSSETPISQ